MRFLFGLFLFLSSFEVLRAEPVRYFVGFDGGYSALTAASSELSKDGHHLDLKALASKSWKHFTLEGGIGGIHNQMDENETKGTLVTERSSVFLFFTDLSTRLRLGKNFEIGPEFQIWMGGGAHLGPIAKEFQVTALGGLQMTYRLPDDFPFRLSAAFLTDLSLDNRQIYLGLAGIQIELPF